MRSGWLPRGLVLAAVAWCVGLGTWLWVAPIRYDGVAWAADVDSSSLVQQATYRVTGSRSFAQVSAFGPVTLLTPVLLAALVAWAVWRGRVLPAAIATGVLFVFTVFAGFSIGPGYLPAAGALIWAVVALADV